MAWDCIKYKVMYGVRKRGGLCVKCGKVRAAPDRVKCQSCLNKSKVNNRNFRERRLLKIVDSLTNKGLIPASEAIEILGISKRWLQKLKERGRIKSRAFSPYEHSPCNWYDEAEVVRLGCELRNYRHKRDKAGRFTG